MSLRIRPATAGDVPLILHFIRSLAEYEKLGPVCVADEARLRETLFGGRAYAEVIVAEWKGQAAGFALFFHNYSTFLAQPGIYLEDLFVEPAFRGQGIGKALLTELARIANRRGCGRVDWQVLDWNKPSIEFYERMGARPLNDWLTYRLTGEALASYGA
jgi:GNAT superfamily N-acetyltransferase